MPERVRRHFGLSAILTLASILVTEIVHHGLGAGPMLSAGLFLLALIPIAYGALGAGILSGLTNTLMLALYTLHYSAPHGVIVSPDQWPGAVVVSGVGLAMSIPMSIIHARELAFRAQIRERTTELQRRNDELTELNHALEAFGYVVSHDLKEPVRAIENYLAVAQEEWPSDESRRYVREAHEANGRLGRMLQGLLEYSRASNVTIQPKTVEVGAVIGGGPARAMYGRALDASGGVLDIEAGIPPVKADEVLAAQLLGNLILNAIRHHPGKPHIRVGSVAAPPGRVHLVVADDGRGFPREVMERFSAIPPKGAATINTGFGLVIAQRAARKLDGRLWLENPPEGGAQAHIELPAADE